MKTSQTMASPPEMVDSVSAFILAKRRVTIEDIPEPKGISLGPTHKITHDDLAFSIVSCHWVSPELCQTS